MDESVIKLRVANSLAGIDPAEWNAVANPQGARFDPFLRWEFLETLESTGAATPATGWSPHHLLIEDDNGTLQAAMPLYAKTHSRGEFIFDYAWADAFERAGGAYYPKLLSAVPFTPVTGRRRLVRPGPDENSLKSALLSGAVQIAADNDLSSLHINFVHEDEQTNLGDIGMLTRYDQQFHWHNDDYSDFDDFLAALSSAKRKNLRKERAKAQDGLTFQHLLGNEIQEADWDAFFDFYMDTGARKWGSPYLLRETFSVLSERMSENLLLILAMDGERPIAGALNLIGSDTLYGRYWGCREHRSMLHFEVCYYQAIDYAIANKLSFVEAGAQGGHKLARGYRPVITRSAHWISHPGLRDAVAQYLEHERSAVESDADFLNERTPFKKNP